jgi:hypothetical protein
MDAHQWRRTGQVAHPENHGFLNLAGAVAFKAVDPEIPKAAGKAGFGYFFEPKFRHAH